MRAVAHDVFISHASDDKAVADAVCAALEGRGIRCWIAPRDVLPGRPYPEAIEEAMAASRIVVVVFSQRAADSPDVRSEIHLAFRQELTIVPFRIQAIHFTRGMNYLLGAVHWLDAIAPPIETHLRTLSERVREHLREGPRSPLQPLEGKPDRSSNPAARAFHERGVAHYHRQEYDAAIVELTRAIELDPTVAWAFNDRGLAHFQADEFDLAIGDLTHGISLDPSRAWAWHGRACAHGKRGDWEAAIRDCTEAIHRDPTVAWFFHDRGAARLQRGDYAAAADDFTHAISLNPDMEWAYRNRAASYERLGRADLARADRQTAEKVKPTNP
jgi:tetratricopeptide (TPR) repeat protein